jgi:hypothetical protein
MVKKTGKAAQPVWVKKGQAAKVGPTPHPNGLSKLGDSFAKINANPNLKDKVGNGRIEHDEMNNPKGISSKKPAPMKPAMGKMRQPKGL